MNFSRIVWQTATARLISFSKQVPGNPATLWHNDTVWHCDTVWWSNHLNLSSSHSRSASHAAKLERKSTKDKVLYLGQSRAEYSELCQREGAGGRGKSERIFTNLNPIYTQQNTTQRATGATEYRKQCCLLKQTFSESLLSWTALITER